MTGLTKAGIPAVLHPSIISLFPPQLDVMNTTSAPQDLYTSEMSFIKSGRPPTPNEKPLSCRTAIGLTAFPRIPQGEPLWAQIRIYEFGDGWSKCLFLIRPNPYQIPCYAVHVNTYSVG